MIHIMYSIFNNHSVKISCNLLTMLEEMVTPFNDIFFRNWHEPNNSSKTISSSHVHQDKSKYFKLDFSIRSNFPSNLAPLKLRYLQPFLIIIFKNLVGTALQKRFIFCHNDSIWLIALIFLETRPQLMRSFTSKLVKISIKISSGNSSK